MTRNVICAQVDVTNRAQLKEAIDDAVQKYGPVDCLINNAGVMLLGKVQTQNPDEWQRMFDTNLMGVLNGIHAVLPSMVARRGGTIVNVSSLGGRKTFSNYAVYCATKFGVHAITEQTREEVSQYDVRVINIAPGAVETEILNHSTDKEIVENCKALKKYIGQPLTTEDTARCVMFAYQQPQRICIREIVVCPTGQGP
ncbi:unnamed protein product [Rotaria sp. Silwood1]|nr:unnamed protein product [Rotaria sp. Silwood1]